MSCVHDVNETAEAEGGGSLNSIFYVLQDDYVMYICYNAAHLLFTLSLGRVETHMQLFLQKKRLLC